MEQQTPKRKSSTVPHQEVEQEDLDNKQIGRITWTVIAVTATSDRDV